MIDAEIRVHATREQLFRLIVVTPIALNVRVLKVMDARWFKIIDAARTSSGVMEVLCGRRDG
jgi:hypothetical protein